MKWHTPVIEVVAEGAANVKKFLGAMYQRKQYATHKETMQKKGA
jgi:hypothetical protein